MFLLCDAKSYKAIFYQVLPQFGRRDLLQRGRQAVKPRPNRIERILSVTDRLLKGSLTSRVDVSEKKPGAIYRLVYWDARRVGNGKVRHNKSRVNKSCERY
jgi:hypothetical protein